MTKSLRLTALTPVLALALAVVPGCGWGNPNPPNSPELYTNTALFEIGDMINTYTIQHKKPPQGLRDLSAFAETFSSGTNAAREGEVVVLWGVAPVEPGSAGPEGQEILAYVKEAPESGGGVLTRDLQIKSLSADAFQAAPKAAGKIEERGKAAKK
jgi:hypothetical protein